LDLKEPKVSELKFKPLEELSYEQALQELEDLVNTLESGENDLHKTLLYFERGQSLASYCISLLDNAELQVEQVLKGEEDDSA
jgi:exodeoxyribonuclease VII small subunit